MVEGKQEGGVVCPPPGKIGLTESKLIHNELKSFYQNCIVSAHIKRRINASPTSKI